MGTSWKWALAAVLLTACGASVVPQVGRTALQDDITTRLTAAGERPQSVTCHEDLVGEVGRTARCDVVISDTNSFQPVATVTSVEGGAVDYELAPALSKAQLEQAVQRLAGRDTGAVACESGLDGVTAARAYCDVDAAGVRARRTVEVTDVEGLTMNFNLLSS